MNNTQGLYASSGLSFYFAYDFCVLPRLSAQHSYLMRFVPFFITIVLAIIVAAHRYNNIIFNYLCLSLMLCNRYCYHLHRQPWYGLWWVILLQYTFVVHTAMSILSCPNLPDSDSEIKPVSLLHQKKNVIVESQQVLVGKAHHLKLRDRCF